MTNLTPFGNVLFFVLTFISLALTAKMSFGLVEHVKREWAKPKNADEKLDFCFGFSVLLTLAVIGFIAAGVFLYCIFK